jgi:DnaJ domain
MVAVEVWITMALLGADLLDVVARSAGHWWGVLPCGAAWTPAGPPRRHPDLIALGLDRMPPSRDELRRAYRAAAKAAHPDVHGGSQEAFLAVSAAFERLSGRIGGRPA